MSKHANEMLTGAEIEAEFNLKANTLRQWRYNGVGPEYIRLGEGRRGHILYKRSVLEAWLAQQTVHPGDDQ
jgi:hypothetical protein